MGGAFLKKCSGTFGLKKLRRDKLNPFKIVKTYFLNAMIVILGRRVRDERNYNKQTRKIISEN